MPMPQPSDSPTKPTLPPFWKWLMRITFAVTMVLFLAPTVYMVKYYAVDKPREDRLVKTGHGWRSAYIAPREADYLPYMEDRARHGPSGERNLAVYTLGETLQQPYISIQRPFECLSAKATLADVATHDSDSQVRAAASDELGKVALGGAVIRR